MDSNPSLKKIKLSLPQVISDLNIKDEDLQQNSISYKILRGLSNVRRGVDEIGKLGVFGDLIHNLRTSVIFTTGNDEIRLQQAEGARIASSVRLLQSQLTNFFKLLTETVPAEDPGSINIKLPNVNDFDELSKVSRDLHLALTQVVYNTDIAGETKIVSVENGSIWLNVFIGIAAVPAIASVVWASAVIYKKIQEGKLLEQQVRSLKVKNDSIEDILKAQKAETQLMIQAEAEHLQSEFFKNQPVENIERIKNSISTFAGLIEKGAEVHPAIVAPEHVSNLFPDTKNIIGLESKIKKLTEGTKEAS